MEILSHLFAALGQLLLWLSSLLVVEELTLGGLARLILSRPFDSHRRQGKETGTRPAGTRSLEVDSRKFQGGASCSQSSTY